MFGNLRNRNGSAKQSSGDKIATPTLSDKTLTCQINHRDRKRTQRKESQRDHMTGNRQYHRTAGVLNNGAHTVCTFNGTRRQPTLTEKKWMRSSFGSFYRKATSSPDEFDSSCGTATGKSQIITHLMVLKTNFLFGKPEL